MENQAKEVIKTGVQHIKGVEGPSIVAALPLVDFIEYQKFNQRNETIMVIYDGNTRLLIRQ